MTSWGKVPALLSCRVPVALTVKHTIKLCPQADCYTDAVQGATELSAEPVPSPVLITGATKIQIKILCAVLMCGTGSTAWFLRLPAKISERGSIPDAVRVLLISNHFLSGQFHWPAEMARLEWGSQHRTDKRQINRSDF